MTFMFSVAPLGEGLKNVRKKPWFLVLVYFNSYVYYVTIDLIHRAYAFLYQLCSYIQVTRDYTALSASNRHWYIHLHVNPRRQNQKQPVFDVSHSRFERN